MKRPDRPRRPPEAPNRAASTGRDVSRAAGRDVGPPPAAAARQRGGAPRGPNRGAGPKLDAESVVFGRHATAAVLKYQPARAQTLWLQAGIDLGPLAEQAAALKLRVEHSDVATLDALVDGQSHQGVVLGCKPFVYVNLDGLARAPAVTLVLDGVLDPRNLGAAARAAHALGAELLVVPKDRAASCTGSAHKAAAGALSRIGVAQVPNLRRALEVLREKGAWIVGAEADAAQRPWDVDLDGQIALVIGGEDRGLRRLTREVCDFVVSIPMADATTSLNAADAATVLLYEAQRQRLSRP